MLNREAAKPGIRRLAEREKRVLYLRFIAGMTQSAIAAVNRPFTRLPSAPGRARVRRTG
ncbi:sigma factor-like helix-turn-helix DNA-binding protein [Streptomyces cyaneofuscatus]|uniref:sigma factor-like helix-turn-helix DNA-binding protein n=1 Tax=Streptomyces cyaneofuscatus TaxID=66883 RepID=UPI0036A463E3